MKCDDSGDGNDDENQCKKWLGSSSKIVTARIRLRQQCSRHFLSGRLFSATGQYSDLMLRMLGAMMVALFIIVVPIIVKRAEFLYPVTLIMRAWLLASLVAFYAIYKDRFLLVLLGVVSVGFVLTCWSFYSDRNSTSASR